MSDSGIGIPDEWKDRIFEPFQQGDSSDTRRYGGTGLGLSICKRIIDLMGGSIAVESRPGCGATFRLELPVERLGPGLGDDSETPGGNRSSGSVDRSRTKEASVLVVEDNETNRKVMEVIVEENSFGNLLVSKRVKPQD